MLIDSDVKILFLFLLYFTSVNQFVVDDKLSRTLPFDNGNFTNLFFQHGVSVLVCIV